jgi:hypothetical protein
MIDKYQSFRCRSLQKANFLNIWIGRRNFRLAFNWTEFDREEEGILDIEPPNPKYICV